MNIRPTCMPKMSVILLSFAGLALTACGPRFNHHASNSAACIPPALAQNCGSAGYYYDGSQSTYAANQQVNYQTGYQTEYQNGYQNGYQGGYYVIPTYHVITPPPAPAPIAAPLPAPTPVNIEIFEPAPVTYTPDPPEPYISEWQPEPAWPTPVESYPWLPEKICPEGTIRGYNGDNCVQVAIPRK